MGSLVVPSVQELVREKISEIPARYVRTDEADPPSSFDAHVESFSQLPVIDMAHLSTSMDVEDSLELKKMHDVCKEWGFFQIVTNGVYPSMEHRVVVNREKARMSLATFCHPNEDGVFGPAPSLITPQNPALFKRIGVADYYKAFFSRELNVKSFLDYVRIQK
ncbi:Oxoglutarate-dependent flavonoid 7-O-demethylase 1 [Ancistrocladus abbreviatus]